MVQADRFRLIGLSFGLMSSLAPTGLLASLSSKHNSTLRRNMNTDKKELQYSVGRSCSYRGTKGMDHPLKVRVIVTRPRSRAPSSGGDRMHGMSVGERATTHSSTSDS